MRLDPLMEWQRLSKHYQSLGDDELRELAADGSDLTETARQVLNDEMKRRGLKQEVTQIAAHSAPAVYDERRNWDDVYIPPPRRNDDEGRSDGPVEYTWKTPLCECDTEEQVRELTEALRRVGIDSWVRGQRGRSSLLSVAADQLDQARAIAAQPIPAEIVDEVRRDADAGPQDFAMPSCPKCGASDPFLAGVNPVNHWRCGACGEEWVEDDSELPIAGER
ncbi:MAG TPA: hypothetical protein VKT25_02925 [Ktedonobacteraceae bacterium]|nr:hypothetical protein [Ktedonobacteraceae bacterium]